MRKLLFINVLGVVAAFMFFSSCTKQGLNTYSATTNIYFTNNYTLSVDTSVITFAYSSATIKDSVVMIPVSAIGSVVNKDRPFKIIISDSSTAKASIHYEPIQDTFKIRAGRVVDTFKIKLKRTADLQTASVSIILKLIPNDNFNTDMQSKVINSITGATISYVSYKIYLNDNLTQPKYWLSTYMGTFSRKKVYATAAALNVSIATMLDILQNNTGSTAISSQVFWGRSMQIYLNQQKAAGNPIYEDDGTTLMLMGPSVQ